MIALLAPLATWAAKSALMQSPIGGILKRFWKPLLIALVLAAAFFWHGHKVKAFGQERFNAGYAQAIEDGKHRNDRLEKKSTKIATEIRSKTDAETVRSNRHADDLRLRGPGLAACPRLPAAAGGPEPERGTAAAGMDRLPDAQRDDIAAVPFDEFVARSATADANRLEVLAWREWHQRLTDEWAKANAASGR